jgi:hypothetical protein
VTTWSGDGSQAAISARGLVKIYKKIGAIKA